MNKIKKSETEWKKLLDEKTYNITRKSGTEQPFTGHMLFLRLTFRPCF